MAAIPASAAEPAEFFASFVGKYCTECHHPLSKKGKVDPTALEWDPGDPHWIKVFDKVDRSEMPLPDPKRQPEATCLKIRRGTVSTTSPKAAPLPGITGHLGVITPVDPTDVLAPTRSGRRSFGKTKFGWARPTFSRPDPKRPQASALQRSLTPDARAAYAGSSVKVSHLQLLLGFALAPLVAFGESPVSEKLSNPSYDHLGTDQNLAPLFAIKPEKSSWENQRPALHERWIQLLGNPSFKSGDYEKTAKVIETFDQPEFRGTVLSQPTGPGGAQQLVLVMEPKKIKLSPRPGAVVPFYHPDAMAGFNLGKKERIMDKLTTQFARHLVQQGYVVVCTEAFPYNTVAQPENDKGLNQWRLAAEKILHDHPKWTGMGKLVHDTRRAIDLLLEQPDIDRDRIVLIGHSLGGKMAFYTGCLDPRVAATIANDFGIGWDFTNWKDPWYLGDKITVEGFSLAHHQLLALHAPRSFLLVAGQYDKPESWQYLNAARPVYSLAGQENALGMIDHASGHQPTKDSMRQAYQWLAEQLELEPQDWEF